MLVLCLYHEPGQGSVPGLLSQLALDLGADSLGCSNPTGEWHSFNLLEPESPLTLSSLMLMKNHRHYVLQAGFHPRVSTLH